MCTGTHAITGGTAAARFDALLHGEPVAPGAVNSRSVPGDITHDQQGPRKRPCQAAPVRARTAGRFRSHRQRIAGGREGLRPGGGSSIEVGTCDCRTCRALCAVCRYRPAETQRQGPLGHRRRYAGNLASCRQGRVREGLRDRQPGRRVHCGSSAASQTLVRHQLDAFRLVRFRPAPSCTTRITHRRPASGATAVGPRSRPLKCRSAIFDGN